MKPKLVTGSGQVGDNVREAPTQASTQPLYRPFYRPLISYVALGMVLAAGCGLLALRHLGQWLAIDEPLRHAGALVVLGGGIPFRAMEAAGLYRAGWAPEVWLTEGVADERDAALEKIGIATLPEHELSRQILIKRGVPAGAIRVVPGSVNNTRAELAAVIRYAPRYTPAGSPEPVILVTSRSHTRRVRIIWDTLTHGGQPAMVRYAESDPYDALRWWRTTTDAFTTARETFGIANSWAGYPIAPRER
jgi:uncharacterized SAM-binding protein YcdF (DUF218 family)